MSFPAAPSRRKTTTRFKEEDPPTSSSDDDDDASDRSYSNCWREGRQVGKSSVYHNDDNSLIPDEHASFQHVGRRNVPLKKRRLNREERQEVGDILDHLITEGSFWRHHNWRIQQWSRQSNNNAPPDDSTPNQSAAASSTTIASPPIEDDMIWMHAQDSRLYQRKVKHQGHQPRDWPHLGHKAWLDPSDQQWDTEWGDGIHPVAFSLMQLSSKSINTWRPSPTFSVSDPIRGATDDTETVASLPLPDWDYDTDPLEPSWKVSSDETPRALLLRCWERAVHAAASSIVVNDGNHPTNHRGGSTSPQRTRSAAMVAGQRLQQHPCEPHETAEGKCTDVWTCSSCGIQRTTKESLESHFYGTLSTMGCCWRVVEQKERDSIARILEQEARSQTDQLVRTILMEVLMQNDDSTKLGAFDILKIVTDKLRVSKRLRSAPPPHDEAKETLEVNLTEPPLHINQFVLDSWRSRLVDRYAEVPR